MDKRTILCSIVALCILQFFILYTMEGKVSEWRSLAVHRSDSVQLLTNTTNLLERRSDSLTHILRAASRYGISPELASDIIRHAYNEGIDPKVAFELVRMESDFRSHVVSSAGAIGLTQIKPSTARTIDAGVEVAELYNTQTNLKLGFRYLRRMLERFESYDRALQAYRVGPTNLQSNKKSIIAQEYAYDVFN